MRKYFLELFAIGLVDSEGRINTEHMTSDALMTAMKTIKNADGVVVVKKGTLIEKATTGEDGKAKFTADLPINHSYSVKEEGYWRNPESGYER